MTNPAYHGLDPDQVQAFLAGADQRALEPPRFDSREDMEAYQVHPLHKEAIAIIAEYREQSIVVDWTG